MEWEDGKLIRVLNHIQEEVTTTCTTSPSPLNRHNNNNVSNSNQNHHNRHHHNRLHHQYQEYENIQEEHDDEHVRKTSTNNNTSCTLSSLKKNNNNYVERCGSPPIKSSNCSIKSCKSISPVSLSSGTCLSPATTLITSSTTTTSSSSTPSPTTTPVSCCNYSVERFLDKSPPSPANISGNNICGNDNSAKSGPTFQLPLGVIGNSNSSSVGFGRNQRESNGEDIEEQATDLSHQSKPLDYRKQSTLINDLASSNTSSLGKRFATKRNKPIPPPLDLSKGAANLSLHNSNSSSNFSSHHFLHPSSPCARSNHSQNGQPSQLIGSPKYTQCDKNLPLRKRWHSWSPISMNGQEESMLPIFHNFSSPGSDEAGREGVCNPNGVVINDAVGSGGTGNGAHGIGSTTNAFNNGSAPNFHQTARSFPSSFGLARSFTNTSPSMQSLQTPPSSFYTPNEPSPKFMNSPIFTYSNPDASPILYQGPFSPMRTTAPCIPSFYPPPNSPFTNLSLGSSPGPQSSSSGGSGVTNPLVNGSASLNNGSSSTNTYFNMIPSTLLSPAPSQTSTNSLSYEDLNEKSISCFTPVWSIFMSGTKVRFGSAGNMDWYLVDFLAQNGDSFLTFKGDFAPHGLEVRKFIVPSSSKERIHITFCPVADPLHPTIEVNCEPSHPFLVEKKGWCSVKPEVFQETYGALSQVLACGDVCIYPGNSKSPTISANQLINPSGGANAQIFSTLTTLSNNSNNGSLTLSEKSPLNGGSSLNLGSLIKMEADEKSIVPISFIPQAQIDQNCLVNLNFGTVGGGNNGKNIGSSMMAPTPYSHPSKKLNLGNSGASDHHHSSSKKSGVSSRKMKGDHSGSAESKGRRPMNAFLLFAKDKRPELIQMHPGKDNRSISVLLGEAWQSLPPPEKAKYSNNAKARAEEQKRIDPDCWKRKRSQSTSI